MSTIFKSLGEQLKSARKRRGLSQGALAARVGRSSTRVSELERELASDRLGRDRLTLFAEICDALDLVPILVPRSRAEQVERTLQRQEPGTSGRGMHTTPFDELFVDLGDDSE